jgi:TonB family protein
MSPSARLLLGLLLATLEGCAHPPTYVVGGRFDELPLQQAREALIEQTLATQLKPPLDTPLKILSVALPDYPAELVRQDITGSIRVQFCVEPDGTVSKVSTVGTPPPELAALSTAAVSRWRFSSPRRNGEPVTICLSYEIVFRIEG